MKIAIVHYHLDPGGVTAVIAAEADVLRTAHIPHVVLAGRQAQAGAGPPAERVRVVSGLDYRAEAGDDTDPENLLVQLRVAAREALGGAPDIWHFHNHSLGKNDLLAGLVARMAESGERMVLQIHDLAEDGRPANYQNIPNPGTLYPLTRRVRYAFLNSRDLEIFTRAGLPADRAAILENPVDPQAMPPPSPGDPLLFAPIRAIRRKNPGELVLLSALLPDRARIAVSRAPRDATALAIHDRWAAFAECRGLPIDFAVVDRHPAAAGAGSGFECWIERASHIVTTSVAEGFGLPLLEAAAWGRPLIGRQIPHLARDQARHGIRAGRLYQELLIPVDWIGTNILREHIRTTLEANARLARQPVPPGLDHGVFKSLTHDGWLDFGNLPESLQQGVIEQLHSPINRRVPVVSTGETRQPAVDWLASALENRAPAVAREQLAPYRLETYQKNLLALLESTGANPATETPGFVDPAAILAAFAGPGAFHFLRSAAPAPTHGPPAWKAVIFDIYGTLLIAPAGGIKPDPAADPALRLLIRRFGRKPPESPSTTLHGIIRQRHEQAGIPHPEIDLRDVWREMLALPPWSEVTELVTEAEETWHPATPMPGAAPCIRRLARSGVSLGVLSNAQCNTLPALGDIAGLLDPDLRILSYQHLMAKPSPELFQLLASRLAERGILPEETLFIGNDPMQDIVPAQAHGFKAALFTGHPGSLREGECQPDITFADWRDIG